MVHNEKENSYGYIDFGTKNLILSDKTEIKKVCDREVSGITEYLFKEYKIQIEEVGRGISAHADIDKYDKFLNVEENHEFNRCFLITVQHLGELQTVFLSAPYYTTDSFVAPHPNGLLFVMNEIIGVFDPRTLEMEIKAELDLPGTMIAVYPYKNDYIFYGEMEICRLSEDMDIVWSFYGRDIFVKCNGKQSAFQMKEDRICLWDFEDNYYEISYNGEVIADIPAK